MQEIRSRLIGGALSKKTSFIHVKMIGR